MTKEYDIDSLVNNIDFKSGEFVTCSNGLMLTNREIEVLKRYNIDYLKCNNLKEIIYLIEEIIEEDDSNDYDDLEDISASISERDYYVNTNK